MKLLHPLAILFLPLCLRASVVKSLFLGDVTSVPLPVTGNWFIGLLGALGCVYLVLGVWSQARKLFSRRPPIDEDLARLNQSFKEQLKEQTVFLTKRMDQVSDEAKDAVLDRERRWNSLQAQVSELGQQFAYLSGALGHKPKR